MTRQAALAMPPARTPAAATTFSLPWAAATVLTMAGLTPIMVISKTPAHGGSWPWSLAIVVVSGTLYGLLVGRGERRLYTMTILLFVYVFLGLAPLVQIRTDSYPSTAQALLTGLNLKAQIVVCVGALAGVLGFLANGGRPVDASEERVIDERRTYVAGTVVLIVAWYSILTVGLPVWFETRDELGVARASIWTNSTVNVMLTATSSVALLMTILALQRIRAQKRDQPRTAANLLLLVQLLTLAITVNPISSPRFLFGTVALSLMAMTGCFSRPGRFRVSAISILVALVLLFPYADAFRHTRPTDGLGDGKGGTLTSLTSGDYDAFAQINNTVYYVDTAGITNGRQFLGVVLFWVPRSVWPHKPQDTGIVLAESRHYAFDNIAAPLWAELLINASWPGLILGMGVLGWFTRLWDRRAVLSPRNSIVATVLPFYMILLLRGSLLAATANLIVILAVAAYVQVRPNTEMST